MMDLDKLTYKYSTLGDFKHIRELLNKCFGRMPINHGALNNLMGGYYLAYDGKKLVGLTGVQSSYEFCGKRITWTCVDPEYQGLGIMTRMLGDLISKEKDTAIYVTAWKLQDRENPNLYPVLNKLGFTLLREDFLNHLNGHTKFCRGCKYQHNCTMCSEWLYYIKV